jgi:hypothetical protein
MKKNQKLVIHAETVALLNAPALGRVRGKNDTMGSAYCPQTVPGPTGGCPVQTVSTPSVDTPGCAGDGGFTVTFKR